MRGLSIAIAAISTLEMVWSLGLTGRRGRVESPAPVIVKKDAQEASPQIDAHEASPHITEHSEKKTIVTQVSNDGTEPRTQVQQEVSRGVRSGGNFLGKRALGTAMFVGGTALSALAGSHYASSHPNFCTQNPAMCQSPYASYSQACREEYKCVLDDYGHQHCKKSFICSPQTVAYNACLQVAGER